MAVGDDDLFDVPGASGGGFGGSDYTGNVWNAIAGGSAGASTPDFGQTLFGLNPAMSGAAALPNSAFNQSSPYVDNSSWLDKVGQFVGSDKFKTLTGDINSAGKTLTDAQTKQQTQDNELINQMRRNAPTSSIGKPSSGASTMAQLVQQLAQKRQALQSSYLGGTAFQPRVQGLLS